MTIEYFYYFRTLVKAGSFSIAAEQCHISQPAMSAAIKSLEHKLGLQLIDRVSKPLRLTPEGRRVYEESLELLQHYEKLQSIAQEEQEPHGVVRLAIIPTLAPYLLPVFLKEFLTEYPKIELHLEELTTEQIVLQLYDGSLDGALLVTPIQEKNLEYEVLFFEELLLYSHQPESKAFIHPKDLDTSKLWLLEEGHCFRDQVINLCDLHTTAMRRFLYKAGSIETLINLVHKYQGSTVIPELAVKSLSASQKKKITPFSTPSPVREVSVIWHRYSAQKKLLQGLVRIIRSKTPAHMKQKEEYLKLPIKHQTDPTNDNHLLR